MTESREDRLSRIRGWVKKRNSFHDWVTTYSTGGSVSYEMTASDIEWLLAQVPDSEIRLDPRRIQAVAFNAVAPAVDAHNTARGYVGADREFLLLSLRRAISEAVVKAVAAETGLPARPVEDAS